MAIVSGRKRCSWGKSRSCGGQAMGFPYCRGRGWGIGDCCGGRGGRGRVGCWFSDSFKSDCGCRFTLYRAGALCLHAAWARACLPCVKYALKSVSKHVRAGSNELSRRAEAQGVQVRPRQLRFEKRAGCRRGDL
eukprot:5267168-Pleurochrysis_carterae.AAC.1